MNENHLLAAFVCLGLVSCATSEQPSTQGARAGKVSQKQAASHQANAGNGAENFNNNWTDKNSQSKQNQAKNSAKNAAKNNAANAAPNVQNGNFSNGLNQTVNSESINSMPNNGESQSDPINGAPLNNKVIDNAAVNGPQGNPAVANALLADAAPMNASAQATQHVNTVSATAAPVPASAAPVPAPLPPASQDLLPSLAELKWVGYRFQEKQRQVQIELVTGGRPKFNLYQEKNQAGQPELVVRFYQTTLRQKIRRDIDASEFRSPVAYVRMRFEALKGHTDVVMTLRDDVQPRLFAKDGSLLLTFDVPERYFGPTPAQHQASGKAELLTHANVLPILEAGSDLPGDVQAAKAYVPDPAAAAFVGAPSDGGTPLQQVVQAPPPAEELAPIPADGSPLPEDFDTGAAANAAAVSGDPATGNLFDHVTGDGEFKGNSAVPLRPKTAKRMPIPKDSGPTPDFGGTEDVNAEEGEDDSDFEGVDPADDNLNDFDDGEGDSTGEDEKFEVDLRPSGDPLIAQSVFLFAVAQDNFGANGTAAPAADNGLEEGLDDGAPVNAGAVANGGPAAAADAPAPSLFEDAANEDPAAAASTMSDAPIDPASMGATTDPLTAGAVQPELIGQDTGNAAASGMSGKNIDLDFRDAPLSEVVRAIADETGINFIVAPAAARILITMRLMKVPWDTALRAILETNGLGMAELGPKMVRIDSLTQITADRQQLEQARQSAQRLEPTKIMILRLSYAPLAEALSHVQNFLRIGVANGDPRARVATDSSTNSLVVEATPRDLAKVKALVERIDIQTPQIRIASRVIGVTKNFSRNLGIAWRGPFNYDQGRGLGFGGLTFPNYMRSQYAIDPQGIGSAGNDNFRFNLGSINNSFAIDLRLAMAEGHEDAEVLQTSDAMVLDNQTASVLSGSSDSFVVGGGGVNGSAPQILTVNYNVNMNVTPRVTADGSVRMTVAISSTSPAAPRATGANAGTINRSVNTVVLKRSGETLAIGSSYETSKTKAVSGIPWLSYLPIIGALFRSTTDTQGQKEMLILVTPTIVNAVPNSGIAASEESADLAVPATVTETTNMESNQGNELNSGNNAANNANNSNNAGNSGNLGNGENTLNQSNSQSLGNQQNAGGNQQNANQSNNGAGNE